MELGCCGATSGVLHSQLITSFPLNSSRYCSWQCDCKPCNCKGSSNMGSWMDARYAVTIVHAWEGNSRPRPDLSVPQLPQHGAALRRNALTIELKCT